MYVSERYCIEHYFVIPARSRVCDSLKVLSDDVSRAKFHVLMILFNSTGEVILGPGSRNEIPEAFPLADLEHFVTSHWHEREGV